MAKITKEAVETIVEAVGGNENIETVTHCVTRLRFVLYDEEKVDKEKLTNLDLVRGAFASGGQYQVVIGQGTVDKVYTELMSVTGRSEESGGRAGDGDSESDTTDKQKSGKKQNGFQRFIRLLADIFIPILPAIITAGLLLGLNNLLTGPGIFFDEAVIEVYPQWTSFSEIIFIIANASFNFLPVLIGWSAVRRFGGSPLLGIVLGLIFVHPELLSAYAYGDASANNEVPTWDLFGWNVEQVGYQGQVLPVLVASYVLAQIEIFLRKRIADSIQVLLVAPIALLVTGFFTFIIIGPVTFGLGNAITDFFLWTFEQYAWLGGLLYGLLYAPLVITGLHHTFLAVDLQLTASTDGTFLWPILALSNIAQGSAAVGMMILAWRDQNMRGLAGSAGLSAYLGVTEPALFGVNLQYRFPFFCALISSAIAATFISINNVLAFAVGVGGIPGIFSIRPGDWGVFFIGMLIVIILPIVLTYLYGRIRKVEV